MTYEFADNSEGLRPTDQFGRDLYRSLGPILDLNEIDSLSGHELEADAFMRCRRKHHGTGHALGSAGVVDSHTCAHGQSSRQFGLNSCQSAIDIIWWYAENGVAPGTAFGFQEFVHHVPRGW